MPERSLETPLGVVTITEQEGAITSIDWRQGSQYISDVLIAAERQLLEYFAHAREQFDLPLAPSGDAFQQSVNALMQRIPYGATREYGDLARDLGSMPQPVGNACGRNSIPIIIPCHRVVGAAGLGGFSAPGGVETKVALLKHEGAYGLLI